MRYLLALVLLGSPDAGLPDAGAKEVPGHLSVYDGSRIPLMWSVDADDGRHCYALDPSDRPILVSCRIEQVIVNSGRNPAHIAGPDAGK